MSESERQMCLVMALGRAEGASLRCTAYSCGRSTGDVLGSMYRGTPSTNSLLRALRLFC